MFSALRQNSLLYILDKNNKPTLKVGQVVSTSSPNYFNNINPYIDVTVIIDGSNAEIKKLPANLSITTSESDSNLVVSESRELMCTEVENMIKNSKQIVESIDYHKSVIESGEEMLAKLNPNIAKQKEQENRISNLETSVGDVKSDVKDIKTMLSELLNKK